MTAPMMGTHSRLFVETTRRLQAPRYGLMSAAQIVEGETHFVAGGIEYFLPIDPTDVGNTQVECLPDSSTFTPRTIPRGLPAGTGDPFEVYAGASCDAVGLTESELRQRAVDTLQVGEGQNVERRLWSETSPAIMSADTDTVVGTAAALPTAVGALERWLYDTYASVGVIHMPRELGAVADSLDLVRADGNVLRTRLGTPVVFGSYPNTGPAGTAPAAGSVWIAATGDVVVRRTSLQVLTDNAQAWFDPILNNAQAIVVRDYLVTFDETAGAALVDL